MRLRVQHSGRWVAALALAFALSLGLHAPAFAQAPNNGCTQQGSIGDPNPQPCLTTLVTTFTEDGRYAFNGLELAAARADDAAYANLLPFCGATADAAPAPGGACSATQMNLFRRLLELEENAGQLLGFGPTTYSLNDNAHALGLALRWTADEEFSAQSSLTSRFANNQLSAVTNRLIALRFMQVVRLARADAAGADGLLAGLEPEDYAGGGASADPGSTQFGRWSVFANGAYGAGTKAPTTYDDAFAFGGTQFSAGADRRLSAHMVAGFLVSTLHQDLDFDSSESTASGGVHGIGYGITGYFQLEGDAGYVNISLGAQRMTLDTTRVVAYPSNNSLVPSVNTTFTSSTVANSWLMTVGSGYSFHTHGFAAEPYLNAQYLHTHIDGFSESTSGPDLGFATSVAGQNVSSLVSVAGLKFSYAILPPFGVILPYAYGEYRHEFKDPSQNVGSQFAMTAPGDDYFEIPTDSINPNYYEVGGGVSSVLPHGAQLYAQYMKVLKLEYYTDYVVSAGFRFEF